MGVEHHLGAPDVLIALLAINAKECFHLHPARLKLRQDMVATLVARAVEQHVDVLLGHRTHPRQLGHVAQRNMAHALMAGCAQHIDVGLAVVPHRESGHQVEVGLGLGLLAPVRQLLQVEDDGAGGQRYTGAEQMAAEQQQRVRGLRWRPHRGLQTQAAQREDHAFGRFQ